MNENKNNYEKVKKSKKSKKKKKIERIKRIKKGLFNPHYSILMRHTQYKLM